MQKSRVPTSYERFTYEGRQICDAKELQGGYCGSCPLDIRVIQMRDPNSWVHTGKGSWEQAAREHGFKCFDDETITYLKIK